jgi:phosphoglycolate phosphatase
MSIELIIFDVDGTLVDSGNDICNALNHAIRPYGIPKVSLQETLTLVGEGVTKLVEKLLVKRSSNLDVALILERFLNFYALHPADNTITYSGVEDTLNQLISYRKAIISNKTESLTRQVLESLSLYHHFEYIVGGDTFPQKKPSPEPVHHALKHFHTTTDKAVLVGDSVYDIEAGHAAGVKTIAVTYGYGFSGFDIKADFKIESFRELPAIISGIR